MLIATVPTVYLMSTIRGEKGGHHVAAPLDDEAPPPPPSSPLTIATPQSQPNTVADLSEDTSPATDIILTPPPSGELKEIIIPAYLPPYRIQKHFVRGTLLADSIGTDAANDKGQTLENTSFIEVASRLLYDSGFEGNFTRKLRPGQSLYDWYKDDLMKVIQNEIEKGSAVFIIEMGINDALKQSMPQTYIALLWEVVRTIRAFKPQIPIYLMSINPCHIFDNLYDDWTSTANAGIVEIAATLRCNFVLSGEALLDEYLEKGHPRLESYFQDRVCHPNLKGRALMGEVLHRHLMHVDASTAVRYTSSRLDVEEGHLASTTCGNFSLLGFVFVPNFTSPLYDESCLKNSRFYVKIQTQGKLFVVSPTPFSITFSRFKSCSTETTADNTVSIKCTDRVTQSDSHLQNTVFLQKNTRIVNVRYYVREVRAIDSPYRSVPEKDTTGIADRAFDIADKSLEVITGTDYSRVANVLLPMKRNVPQPVWIRDNHTKAVFIVDYNSLTVAPDELFATFASNVTKKLYHGALDVEFIASTAFQSIIASEVNQISQNDTCVFISIGYKDFAQGTTLARFASLYRDGLAELRGKFPFLCIGITPVSLFERDAEDFGREKNLWLHQANLGLTEIALAFRAILIGNQVPEGQLRASLQGTAPYDKGFRLSVSCFISKVAGTVVKPLWVNTTGRCNTNPRVTLTFAWIGAHVYADPLPVEVEITHAWFQAFLRVPVYGLYTFTTHTSKGKAAQKDGHYPLGGTPVSYKMQENVTESVLVLTRKYLNRVEHAGMNLNKFGITPAQAKKGGRIRIRSKRKFK